MRYAYCSSLGYRRRHRNGEHMDPFNFQRWNSYDMSHNTNPFVSHSVSLSLSSLAIRIISTPCQVACQHSQQLAVFYFHKTGVFFCHCQGFLRSSSSDNLNTPSFFMNRFIVGTLAIRSNGVIKAGNKGLNLVGLYCTKEHLNRGVLP